MSVLFCFTIMEHLSLSLTLSLAAITTTLSSIQPLATSLLADNILLLLFTAHTFLM